MKHDHPQAHQHHGGHHRFDDAAKWASVFDAPERDAWQKPDAVIAALALKPNDVVADIGAGSGYFSMRIARVVREGKVLAVDVEPAMVAHLRERAAKESLANVVAVEGAFDDPKLPEKASVAIVVDTAHHIEGRTAYFEKLRMQMMPARHSRSSSSTPIASCPWVHRPQCASHTTSSRKSSRPRVGPKSPSMSIRCRTSTSRRIARDSS